MSKCLVDSTSKKDKIVFVNWMFNVISVNPNIKNISIAKKERDIYHKKVARLFMRLLTQDCKNELKEAIRYEGDYALFNAFKLLGEVSSRELLNDKVVQKESIKYMKYIDLDELKKAFK